MRTIPKVDGVRYKGPQPRRSIHSDRMEDENITRSPEQRLRSKQKNENSSKTSEDNEGLFSDMRKGNVYIDNVNIYYPSNASPVQSGPYDWETSANKSSPVRHPDSSPKNGDDFSSIGWKMEKRNSEDKTPKLRRDSSNRRRPGRDRREVSSPPKSHQLRKLIKRWWSQAKNTFFNIPITYFIILSVVCFIAGAISFFRSEDSVYSVGNMKPLTKQELTIEILNISLEFPSQSENIWPQLSSGIKKVELNPSHPSVFLLIHDSEEDTSMCLAKKFAKLAMRFLNATNQNLLVLEGEKLSKDERLLADYGELIADKQHQVEQHRTMIVKDLHKVPGEVARSFHSFCDIETPLVDKAIYFFTMKASGVNRFVDKPTLLAERELTNIWSKELNMDILMPLIIRITDNVLIVKPEYNITSCDI